ncbi:squalene synthase HpnC [Stieleria sp. JC731]|uniref:squalene synthase HpnC n=1 Tax=Pirellulaceae TaxID=2691357 RepID=UPI001E61A1D1|nr:squalene synthase HpnC [Stieleria sp. JC731]MCC9599607.1 squalene synthase HpnC [Stieleria sp. JC731]
MEPESLSSTSHSALIVRQSERACRQLARGHYENFLVASILLPRRLRAPFYSIYAFCRTADDVADESDSPQHAHEGLDRIQEELQATFSGNPPDHSFYPALSHTITTYAMERQPFFDLLSAFRQDQEVNRYESMDQLLDYCSRSANPVGRMILKLAGIDDTQRLELSDQICTGLQLVNFWQDVRRDLLIGRVYLPSQLCDRFDVDESMLSQQTTAKPLRRLLAELCDETEGYFRRGRLLADDVPKWLAKDIKLFIHGGLETLNAIRRIDFDVLRKRPKVGKLTQGKLVLLAVLGRL